MGFFSSIFGGAIAAPIDAVRKIIDEVYVSEEEILTKKILMERVAQKPGLAQAEINKVEASHRSLFVAGWRPFIGWVCGIALLNHLILVPYIEFFSHVQMPTTQDKILFDLVLALLGVTSTLRTIEKFGGRTK